jgi:histidinol-phosphate/aromatic aminotransferase/cobyric acid decarboxylase-like protein
MHRVFLSTLPVVTIPWRVDHRSPRRGRLAADATGACFHGGAFFEAVGEEFDRLERGQSVINADVLDAWFPPAPSVVAALREYLPWIARTSPPVAAGGLARTIASVRGVPLECVLPGAGSSDLIFLALREWLGPGSRVLLLDPMYGEYAHVCERVIGCRADRFPLARADGYRLDLEAWAARLAEGYDLAVLVNPNNPTGRHVDRADLEDALRQVPARTRVWIDEAYIEYAGAGESLERFSVETPNVVVAKSMSKVYALSGLRAAYLAGPADVVESLRPLCPPWAVSLPAQVAAVLALKSPEHYAACHKETRALRRELAAGLAAIDPRIDVLEGAANFVLCHLPDDGQDAEALIRRARARGLYLRGAGGTGAVLGDHAVRIAVKDGETQGRMLEILGKVW